MIATMTGMKIVLMRKWEVEEGTFCPFNELKFTKSLPSCKVGTLTVPWLMNRTDWN